MMGMPNRVNSGFGSIRMNFSRSASPGDTALQAPQVLSSTDLIMVLAHHTFEHQLAKAIPPNAF